MYYELHLFFNAIKYDYTIYNNFHVYDVDNNIRLSIAVNRPFERCYFMILAIYIILQNCILWQTIYGSAYIGPCTIYII